MNGFFSSSPLWQMAGLTFIRWIMGIFLIWHGWEIFNMAKISEYAGWDVFKPSSAKLLVYAGKAAELVAGVLFLLGLFTRIAALLTAGTMGYIAFFIGKGIIWNSDQHPFLFVLLAGVFFFTGPGKISLDHYLFAKNRR